MLRPGPWVRALVPTTLFQTQAQHLRIISWFLFYLFDLIPHYLSVKFVIELWNRKSKIKEIYLKKDWPLVTSYYGCKNVCWGRLWCQLSEDHEHWWPFLKARMGVVFYKKKQLGHRGGGPVVRVLLCSALIGLSIFFSQLEHSKPA